MVMEQKPDFSGEYTLDLKASELDGDAATVRSAVLRIHHSEPIVRVQCEFVFEENSLNYKVERETDGRDVVDGNESSTTSSLRWFGASLVFDDRTDGPGEAPVTTSWRYELDPSGRLLTAIERRRGGGRDRDNVWVFDRR
jgi:hypothetical protein